MKNFTSPHFRLWKCVSFDEVLLGYIEDFEIHRTELAALHDESFSWAASCCGGESTLAADILQTLYLKIPASTLSSWMLQNLPFTAPVWVIFIKRAGVAGQTGSVIGAVPLPSATGFQAVPLVLTSTL